MSQQIRVLQCIECSLYQVDIVKKSNRWDCKVCRQKQVVHKEFFRESGADCRLKTQQLNLERGQKRQAQEDRQILAVQEQESECLLIGDTPIPLPKKAPSKWAAFVDETIPQPPKIKHNSKDEVGNTSSKSRDSYKRKAPDQPIANNKKSFSKWQKFL